MVIAMLTVSFGASIGNLVTKETLGRKLRCSASFIWPISGSAAFPRCACFSCSPPLCACFTETARNCRPGFWSMDLVACLVLHFYFGTAANVLDTFKTSMGLFAAGCYLAIFGGVLNLVLDFVLARLGLLGIYLATLLSEVGTTYFPKGFYVPGRISSAAGAVFSSKCCGSCCLRWAAWPHQPVLCLGEGDDRFSPFWRRA